MSITCEFVKLESVLHIDEKLKCGDIYIRTSGVFSLTCGFCESHEFFTLDSYSDHFNCHMEKEKQRTTKLEQPTSLEIPLGNLPCDDDAGTTHEDPLMNDFCILVPQPLPPDVKDDKIIGDSEYAINDVKLSSPAHDLREHFYKAPYECEYCSSTMKTKKNFLAHLWKVHSIGVSCRYCYKQLSTEFSRSEHEKIHTGHPSFVNRPPCTCSEPNCSKHKHICDICSAGLTSKFGLIKHKWRVHLVGVCCRHCDKQFASEQTRDDHERHHAGRLKPIKPIRKLQMRPCYCKKPECPKHRRRGPPKRQPLKCKHCDEEFVYSVDFRKHLWTAHNTGSKCRFCDRQFSNRGNLNVHERTHTGEMPFSCTYCSRAFNTSTTLKIHIMAHEDNRPLLCTLCGKRFINNQKLNRHTKEYHTLNIIYSCTLCDETFENRTRLYRHRRSIHNNYKNIVLTCDICKRQFNTRKCLVQHMKIHTGKKLYNCRYCDLSFAQAAGKRGHERSKHEDIIILA